jgi:glycosyltransferase involved in cell wall biosynthesis
MKSPPLVSILTPSFNQGRWLGHAVASVAAQTYVHVEHVVVDGGSTDTSLDVLGSTHSGLLTWSSGQDRGQSHALNLAFARSHGEIIGWINSDDAYCDTRAVEWAVDTFRRETEVDVIYGSALLVDADNQVRLILKPPRFSRTGLEAVNYLIQPAVFIRRSAIDRLDCFVDEALRYVMDRDLWFRLLDRGAKFQRVDHVLSVDRWQASRKVAQPEYLEEAAAYDAHRGFDRSRTSRIRALSIRAEMRLGGLLALGHLTTIDAALPLEVPNVRTVAISQLLLRRAQLTEMARSATESTADPDASE